MRRLLVAGVISMLAILPALAGTKPATYGYDGLTTYHWNMPTGLVVDVDLPLAGVSNGGTTTVTVSATSDEDAIYYARIFYRSSYHQYVTPTTDNFTYKTRAVGLYDDVTTEASTSFLWEQEIEGIYNADTLFADIVRTVDGVPGDTLRVATIVVDMPIGDVPTTNQDGYQIAAHHNGSTYPYSGTPAEWGMLTAAFVTDAHIFETSTYPGLNYEHWIQQMRATPGNHNEMVIGFSDLGVWNNPSYPFRERRWHYLKAIYDDALNDGALGLAENGLADVDIFVHYTDGNLAVTTRSGTTDNYLLNHTYPPARDYWLRFMVEEWNHANGRLPNVGFMLDVFEIYTCYPMDGVYAPDVVDFDRDGTELSDDRDEQILLLESNIAILQEWRAAIAATSSDPIVGSHFILGANAYYARHYPQILPELDMLLVEDFQCPPGCGTSYGDVTVTNPYYWATLPGYQNDTWSSLLLVEDLYYNDGASSDLFYVGAHLRDVTGVSGLYIEAQSSCGDNEHVNPVIGEVVGLLVNGAVGIYHVEDDPGDYGRQWNHPTEDGLTDLAAIGTAAEAAVRDSLTEGSLAGQIYFHREYSNGLVEMVIDPTGVCDSGYTPEYKVTMAGTVERLSSGWTDPYDTTPPVLQFSTPVLSENGSGNLRISTTATADESATMSLWWRQMAAGSNQDITPVTPATTTHNAIWDTDATWASVQGDSIYVIGVATDAALNTCDPVVEAALIEATGGTTTNHYYVDTGGTKTYATLAAAFAANAANIVTADEIHIYHCEATTGVRDSVQVSLSGYTMGADNYVKVVGDENHGGEYDPTIYRLYRLNGTNQPMFAVSTTPVVMFFEDLQFYSASTDADGAIFTRDTTGISIFDVTFDSCVIKGPNATAAQVGPYAPVRLANLTDTYLALRFYNCLMYGWHRGFHFAASCTYDVAHGMNNTSINCYYGFSTSSSSSILENNITWGSNDNWASTGTVDYNACDVSTGVGSNGISLSSYTASQVFSDAAGGDYHLVSGSPCYGNGADLSAYILDDIDGDSRSAWSIGMDEGIAP